MDVPTSLPILPLVDDATPVLLPGMIARLPIQHRSDAQLILAHSLTKGIREVRSSASLLGCVPMRSPQLSQNGQRVLKSKGDPRSRNERSLLDLTTITRDDMFNYGCVAKILGAQGRGTGELSLLIEGISRFKLGKIRNEKPYIEAEVRHHIEDLHLTQDPAIQDLFARLKQQSQEFLEFLKVSSLLPRKPSPLLLRRLEIYIEKKTVEEVSLLGDFMTNIVDASVEDKLEVLATWDLQERLEKIIEILSKQMEMINGNMKVTSISIISLPDRSEKNKIGNSQRDITRRNLLGFGAGQMPAFPPGSGQDNEEDADELMELRKRLEDAKMSAEAQKVADKELKRLTKMNPAQLEYQVCRNYLETLAEIPWSRMSEDRLGLETLSRARKQLDDDHYGLEKVKKRLLEYLAVLKLKHSVNNELDMKIEKLSNKDASSSKDGTDDHEVKDSDTSEVKLQLLKSKRMVDKSPILLLVGPPGTGKTSLAKSVATALGRKFHRISLGGVRDEAEIRGHRKTYVAAMPGLIVNGLKKVRVANPVFLLDEIDKVGTSSFHGDPSAAMLEVLDPEQNCTFTDHYVNIPIDLSTVLFIATANSLDTIPPPLLDRMETISLSGYTTVEKRHIATRHLIPKQILTNGLGSNDVQFKNEVIDQIINSYTREAGVRNLEREIGSVCRAKAVEYSEAKDASVMEQYSSQVSLEDLERILGVEKFEEELAEKTARPGLVTGLVAYNTGGNGGILFIEIVDMPGRGRVQLTGKLGDVLKESVEVALSWVKAHSYDLGLTEDPTADIMVKRNIHVHCPAGAIPKDGPSAGLAHTIALISLFSGNAVSPTLAMTGEISLRGKVLAVGGIKEKLIGALRAHVRTVIIPAANERDLKDLPTEVIGKDGLKIIPVKHIWEAMTYVWPEKRWRGNHHVAGIESQL